MGKSVQTTVRIPEELYKKYRTWLMEKGYSINRHFNEIVRLTVGVAEEKRLKPEEVKEKLVKELALELFFPDYGKNPFFKKGVEEERRRIVRHLIEKKSKEGKVKVEDLIEEVSDLLGISRGVAERIVREVRKESQNS